MTDKLLITDREKIRQEWGKSGKDAQQCIEILRNWAKTQKHLPEVPSDNMIEFFLTNCKYSIERTKKNIDFCYTARDLMPEMYRGFDTPNSNSLDIMLYTGYAVLLPNLTPSLHRIAISKMKEVDPDKADITKYLSYFVSHFYEIRMQEDLALGDIVILDAEHLKFNVMNKLTPTFLKQFATIVQKVQNNRMKALHFLSPPSYMDVIISMFKGFLSKKLQDRIFIHRKLEDLYEHVPKEMLPSDYGGKEKSLDELEELWKKKLLEYTDRFQKLETMHVNESLRPEELRNEEDLFYGNFKKIDID
ncbi:unnamed protein product [Phyllotreta striolata]|uniref:CRAL-TRIO domain-containing protein n=1 Tax=Phyllotreta striolata TaxID=444603 RepID=A0A9N9XP04_PHYSR|nr:unnamed protein product [Phyllotreta striolata]